MIGYEPAALEILKAKKGGKFIVLQANPDFTVAHELLFSIDLCALCSHQSWRGERSSEWDLCRSSALGLHRWKTDLFDACRSEVTLFQVLSTCPRSYDTAQFV